MFSKAKLLAVVAIAVLALGLMLPIKTQASTNTSTFTPVADAYVYQSNPSTNYGSLNNLRVDGSPIIRSYLRFSLSGLSGYTITSAILKIYANSSLSAGFSVVEVPDDNWEESTITYDNAPETGNAITNSGAVSSGKWVSIDITAYIAGDGDYNLAFTPLSTTNLSLASREAGANAPQLVVTLSSSGPTPTQTSTLSGSNTPTPTPTGTLAATNTPTPTATVGSGSGQVPNFSHVIVMVFENKEYSSVIGSSSWPNFNRLANQYASLTKFYAVGHPSLPNYLAMTSGSTQGITTDCTSCWVNATNIVDSVEDSGRSMRAYMESMPNPCFIGSSGKYAQRHNPFIYYDDIRTDSTRCKNDIVPLTQLDDDLNNNKLPNYVWIVPNVCNDAHDCSGSTADTFLNSEVNLILGSKSWDANSLLVLTFDEGSSSASCCGLPSSAGGHVATILISSLVKPGYQDSTPYSHYSLLKTVEKAWGLPYLVHDGDSATSLITSPWK